jgi:CarD family transcriptional regulator, regulator of rRNA transcription
MTFEHRRFDNADHAHEIGTDLSFEGHGSQVERPATPVGFRRNDFIVYAGHGVGQILAIEVQTVAGTELEFFVIYFAKSKMKARVPTQKAASIGMRKLSSPAAIEQVRWTMSQIPSRTRTNWARLTKEYEAKIKSGAILALAEVMRDLYRKTTEPEQSYSERHLYAVALDRVSQEIARVERVTEEDVVLELETLLMRRTARRPHGR